MPNPDTYTAIQQLWHFLSEGQEGRPEQRVYLVERKESDIDQGPVNEFTRQLLALINTAAFDEKHLIREWSAGANLARAALSTLGSRARKEFVRCSPDVCDISYSDQHKQDLTSLLEYVRLMYFEQT